VNSQCFPFFHFVRELREHHRDKDTDTDTHHSFDDEEPSPWIFTNRGTGHIISDCVRNKATEGSGKGRGGIVESFTRQFCTQKRKISREPRHLSPLVATSSRFHHKLPYSPVPWLKV
jgi:hypothetical protein